MKNFFSYILKPQGWISKVIIGALIITLIILGFTGHLELIRNILDSQPLVFKVGSFTFSIYTLLRIIITLIVLFWITNFILSTGEKYLKKITKIKASNKSLLMKGFQIFLYFVMLMIGLDVIGIDLTTLAVFGGAIGIGLGFGLQKITSNFISGLILLVEKSVEEGDLLTLQDGTMAFVKRTNARYTLVETFDSREIMVPNEDFITSRVTNWTFSDKKGRIEINIGVSYNSDLDKVYELILEAAKEHTLCISDPPPLCFLLDFAESSVNFVLYFWIADISAGRRRARSDVMFSIWRKLKSNNIEIPFPQRDINIKNIDALR